METEASKTTKTIEQLMDERHAAFIAADAIGFEEENPITNRWRKANAAYVRARDKRAQTN